MNAPATIAIRVKPGSSRTRVGGGYPGPYGLALVVAVHARAVDGAATAAAVHAVADALMLKARQIRCSAGHTSRDKLLIVEEPPADIAMRLELLIALSP
jgi:uncharacterized protein YggU (UPF0235/DUF167 family)